MTKANANKETIQAVANTTAAAVTVATATPKTQIANAVFKQAFASPTPVARKDMIAAAMKEAGISKDCAATYLQNYKRKNGLQKNSVKTEAATA